MNLPTWLCELYGKPFGVFVASGTLALEAAIRLLGIPKGKDVLFPEIGCWKIGYAIDRCACRPVPVTVDPSLLLSPETVSAHARSREVAACVVVHYLGLPIDVGRVRNALPAGIPIIEDASQAWRLRYSSACVGQHSDIVVTSFGQTKPMSVGYGGALFFGDQKLLNEFNLSFLGQINRSCAPIPYGLPLPADQVLITAAKKADITLRIRREFASMVEETLCAHQDWYPWRLKPGDEPSWTRVPVFFKEVRDLRRFLRLAHSHSVAYQTPHRRNVTSVPYIFGARAKKHDRSYVLIYPTARNKTSWSSLMGLQAI